MFRWNLVGDFIIDGILDKKMSLKISYRGFCFVSISSAMKFFSKNNDDEIFIINSFFLKKFKCVHMSPLCLQDLNQRGLL
jgi:hypothetical protein